MGDELLSNKNLPAKYLRLRRPCDKCGLYFHPSTKGTHICDECHKLIIIERGDRIRLKKSQQKQKQNVT